MADIISRMRLDSSEYDNKIRNAAKNLQSFEQECRKAGKSLNDVSDANVEYIQSLGRMETSAKSTKGKLGELSNAFTDLRAQYNRLTEEEKNGKYGQALSASLEQMKTRINDAKAELSGINAELGNTDKQSQSASGGLLDLAEKFGINVPKITAMGAALGTTTAALKVAKDAFLASEANVDEWGRIVESSKSVYEGFLFSLNNSDISGFLGRINEIITAARNAYNALDTLGSMRTIQTKQISGQMTENDRLRLMLQTGTYIAPQDGRAPTPGMVNGQRLTQEQLRIVERQLKNGIQTVTTLIGNEVKQSTTAIDEFYNRFSKEMGMGLKEFRQGTSSWAEFEKRVQGGQQYKQWEDDRKRYTQLAASFVAGAAEKLNAMGKTNPYAQYRGWDVFRVDGSRFQQLVQLIQQRDQRAGQAYSMQGQAYRTMNRVEGITTRIGGGGGGTTSGRGGGGTANTPPPVGSIAEQEQKVQALTKAWKEATDQAGRDGYLAQLNEAKALLDQMQGKVKEVIPEGSLKDLKARLGELQKERELLTDPVDIVVQDQAISELQEKIDRLNGKVTIDVETSNTLTAGESLIQSVSQSIADANIEADVAALTNTLEVIFQEGIDGIDINVDGVYEQIFGAGVPDEYWENLAAQVNEALKKAGAGMTIEIDPKTGNIVKKFAKEGKETGESWRAAAGAIQAVGNAMQGIENPTARIIGIIGEAIANIALGFSKQSLEAAGGGPVAWIAAIAGGLATMTSTIAAIKSATAGAYAEGGIIPGNRYHDELTANVSSGELILNRAQQGNLAAQLQGAEATGSGASRPYVSGETIFLGVNNYLRRSGKGELITTK